MMASEAAPMEEQQQYDETEMGEEGEEEVSTRLKLVLVFN